jgi:5,10-methylenetetrahydromethanopterin reductase
MLDREGLGGPADLAVVGTEDEVQAGIARYAATGLTDFLAVEFGTPEERHTTRELLRGLL